MIGADKITSEQRFSIHVLNRSLIVLVPALLVLASIFTIAGDHILEAQTRAAFVPLLVMTALVLGGALACVRFGRWQHARFVTVWTAAACVAYAIAFTGGFEHSVAAPAILLPPMLVLCLYTGHTGAAMAVAIAAPTVAIELYTHLFGTHFVDRTSRSNPTANLFIVIGSCYLMLCAILYTLATANVRLRAALRTERDLHQDMAAQDMLTGLFNRRGFHTNLAALCSDILPQQRAVLIYIDLDRFKPINDRFGHAAGDHVLKTIGQRLQSALPRAACIARIGGDEFAIIHPEERSQEAIASLCNHVEQVIGEPIDLDEAVLTVGGTIGHAIIPDDGADPDLLLNLADRHMLARKAKRYRQANRDLSPADGAIAELSLT